MIKEKSYKFRCYPNRNQKEYFSQCFGCVRKIFNDALHTISNSLNAVSYWEYEQVFQTKIEEESTDKSKKKIHVLDSSGNPIPVWKKNEENKLALDEFGNKMPIFERVRRYSKKPFNTFDISPQISLIKKEKGFEYLSDVHSIPLITSLRNLESAFNKFFNESGGYPKFKRKFDRNSFSFHQGYTIDRKKSCILLPKIKDNELKIVFHREMEGTPKTCTISLDKNGTYWISFCCQIEPYSVELSTPDKSKAIGIDVNIDGFYDSNGNIYETPRPMKENQDRLAYMQRRLALMESKSNRWKKQKIRIAKLNAYIKNVRKDWMHKMTDELTSNPNIKTICIEDLYVKGMTKSAKGDMENPGKMVKQKAGLNRALLDVSFGEFRRQLEYKCKRNGISLLFADRFFASSKICNTCGTKNNLLTLKDRVWTCPECENENVRDFNAAKNIVDFCFFALDKGTTTEKRKTTKKKAGVRRCQVA
jgi:putative transposase